MGTLRSLCAIMLLLAVAFATLSTPSARAAIPASILPNGGFEIESSATPGRPDGWKYNAYAYWATFTWDADVALVGRHSMRISAEEPDDAYLSTVVPVRPHTTYVLSGWIKTQDVDPAGPGANLSLVGTWTHSDAVVGTRDWTYAWLRFDSGDSTEVTIGARLGYWAGIATGTAWFDGLRLTPIDASAAIPDWKILVLIYDRTDFTYTDSGGVSRHGVAQMSQAERNRAAREANTFVAQDIPQLTGGMMTPSVTIRYPDHPLTQLSAYGNAWWPAPGDTAADRDPNFDSVIVIWDPRTVDQNTGAQINISNAAGLTPGMGVGQTYETQIIESTGYGHRNVFKHEWGHSILFYFEALGASPLPTVDNHATAGQYVHCPTGEPYVWVDETAFDLIPNSIYHNSSGFTHDYYSGTVATADQPTRCLGITRTAWALGGPASRPAYYPYYHQLDLAPASAEQIGQPGAMARHQLTITNTGNLTDTFHLQIAGGGWGVNAPADTGPVGPGKAAQVEVAVQIPPDAPADARQSLLVTATSEGDPAQSAQAGLTSVAGRRPSPAPPYQVWLPLVRR